MPARSHKPYHVGSNPTSAICWLVLGGLVVWCLVVESTGKELLEHTKYQTPSTKHQAQEQPSTQTWQSGQVESLVNDCGFDSHLG